MLYGRTLDGLDNLIGLEQDWTDLATSVPNCRLTQTFEWCRLAWETRDNPPSDRLVCATVWHDERLVAVWPFRVKGTGLMKHIAPLGCAMEEEYGDPLIAEDIDADQACAHLLKQVRKYADTLYVYSTVQGSPIEQQLRKFGRFNIPVSMESYCVKQTSAQSFDEFMQGYSSNFRNNLKQKRKRFSKLGQLRFELPDERQTSIETVDWVLAEKRDWVERQQKACPWVYEAATRDFFVAASSIRSDVGRLGLFRLTLDGKPVAAFLATIDRTRIEMLVTSFDPEYARFSPGMLLIEDVVRWGYAHGLSFDMRPLWLEYKERWANETVTVTTFRAPLTPKGLVFLLPLYAKFRFKKSVRSVLTAQQRETVKGILKWPLQLKARLTSYLRPDAHAQAIEK